MTVTVNADNDAPSAEAGANITVDENASVQLVGSGVDPEGQGLSYQWVQTGGTPVVLDDASASSPSFDAPEGLVNSDLTFELQVSDGTNTSVDTVTVTVNADNDAPSAEAGADMAVEESTSVQLDGSGLDPEGQGLTFEWVQTSGPIVTLDDSSASSPTFSAPDLLSNSDIVFELRVSDGENSSTDTVTITVNADNDAPAASAGPNLSAAEDTIVQLQGTATDPEGQGLTYQWIQTGGPSVTLDDPNSDAPTFTAPNIAGDEDITFELRVSDGENTTVDSVSITIEADDDAPVDVSAGPNQDVDELDVVQLVGNGSDLEGQDLTYTWIQTGGPTVALDDPNATSPTFEAPQGLSNTDITFELQVSDGSQVTTDNVTVTVHADDDAPSSQAGADMTVEENDLVTLSGSGTDPENQGLTYTWVQTAGPAVVLDDPSSPDASFHAPEGLVNSTILFELQVSDGVNTSTDEVSILVEADDDQPVAFAGPNQILEEGQPFTLSGSGTDPEGQPLSYTWVQTGGPAVALDDANSPTPTFTAPNEISNTLITFELQVSDGTYTSVDTVTLTINADNDAPVALAGLDQSVEENATVQLSGDATDPENQALTYRWVQTGGPLVVLDDTSAAAPSFEAPEGLSNSDITFELQVSDGTNTSSDTVTITVNADNDAPLSEAGPTQAVEEGAQVQLAGEAFDPEGQGLTYTWVQVGGPAVELSDANDPNAVFDVPNLLSNTDIVFQLQVSDGENLSVDTVTIQVNADNDAPIADAGDPIVVSGETLVELTGGGSDAEGQDLVYEWVRISGPPVQLIGGDTPNASFFAPQGVDDTIRFQLNVSDGTNLSVDNVDVFVIDSENAGTPETQASIVPDSDDQPRQGGPTDGGGATQAVGGVLPEAQGADPDAAQVEELLDEAQESLVELNEALAAGATDFDLPGILPQEITDQGFHSIFVESHPDDLDLDRPSGALPTQEGARNFVAPEANIETQDGQAEEEQESEAEDSGLLARFWGLMRGAAGTTSTNKASEDKDKAN